MPATSSPKKRTVKNIAAELNETIAKARDLRSELVDNFEGVEVEFVVNGDKTWVYANIKQTLFY